MLNYAVPGNYSWKASTTRNLNCNVDRVLSVTMITSWHGNCVFRITGDLWGESAHYDDVIMGTIASQITSLTSVYSTVYSGADQSKHQSSASLAFVWGIHRGPVNSPHKWPVTRKMFPFDDVIMRWSVASIHKSMWCFGIFYVVSLTILLHEQSSCWYTAWYICTML